MARTACRLLVVAVCAASLALVHRATACTGIAIRPQDGSVITGRTLEFAYDLHSQLIVIPRGQQYTGTVANNRSGMRWTGKYAMAGTSMVELPVICDGLNEKGLGVGVFYFPGYAQYQPVTDGELDRTIAPWQLPTYLLGTCATVEEAIHAAREVVIGEAIAPVLNLCPPVHYVVHDATGRCAVLEPLGGPLTVYDNPLGVITNSPTFDWQMTNLRNYINLFTGDPKPIKLAGVELAPFGAGAGMHGLPGDFSPPSRFVRAVAFTQTSVPVKSAIDGVDQVLHLLNQFDIPKGLVRVAQPGEQPLDEFTRWTSVSDLKNQRFYFRNYENEQVRMIDLKAADLDAARPAIIAVDTEQTYVDVTPRVRTEAGKPPRDGQVSAK